MNKCDSELMSLSLEQNGYKPAESPLQADIIVFNTCSVRQHAEDRVKARVESIKNRLKEHAIIVIAGCMAQRTGKDLIDTGLADVVIGPFQTPDTGKIISRYTENRKINVYISQLKEDFAGRINQKLADKAGSWHKWITITHGCENFCSYCIVPYVRGPLLSMPSETILEYTRILASGGIKEITLLGQNVNQYGTDSDDIPFYKLLEKTAETPDIERINFLTSHPKDFDENIVSVIRDHGNISRGIHLPLQSGSDSILERMNRKYSIKNYMDIIEKIDKILGVYSVSTDLIVGFPGETEGDYQSTLEAVKKIRFDEAFMYAYSPREGTQAYSITETISRQEKIDRLNSLIDLQRKTAREKLKARLDNTEEMIVERISKRSDEEIMGRTFLNHSAVTQGLPEDIGKKIRIRITGIKGATLYGRRIA